MSAFKLSPSPEAERLVMGLRAVAVLGLAAIPLNYAVSRGTKSGSALTQMLAVGGFADIR